MGFDQNDPKPATLTTHKKTTKVNIGVVIGVLLFFAVAAAVWLWVGFNQRENSNRLHEKMTPEPPTAPAPR